MTDPHLRRVCEQVSVASWGTPLKVAVTGLLESLVILENRPPVSSPALFHSPRPQYIKPSLLQHPSCLPFLAYARGQAVRDTQTN